MDQVDFLVRDRLVVPQPFIGLADRLSIGITQRVVIFISVHGLQKMNHSSKFGGW
jgi:predicted O-linked N-acetylglucosamine transferase (SPINDLY family)